MEFDHLAGENTLATWVFSNDLGTVLPQGKAINKWKGLEKVTLYLLLFIISWDQKYLKHYSQIPRYNTEKHAHIHQINVIFD